MTFSDLTVIMQKLKIRNLYRRYLHHKKSFRGGSSIEAFYINWKKTGGRYWPPPCQCPIVAIMSNICSGRVLSYISDLEKVGTSLSKAESQPTWLGKSGLLWLDPIQDKTPLYDQLLQTYSWTQKVQQWGGGGGGELLAFVAIFLKTLI